MTDDRMRDLRDGPEPLDLRSEPLDLRSEPLAVLFKHSPRCWVSASAMRQVQAFADSHPDVPVYVVNVIAERRLSRDLAAALRVRHESPQAIVLREGAVVWHGSHGGVTAEALAREVAKVGSPR